MRTLFALVAFLLLDSVCWGQGTPGGTYRAPADDLTAMSSYSTAPNVRYEIRIDWPVAKKDKLGIEKDVRANKTYYVMGGQLYGFKKNLQEFCKKEKMHVDDVQTGGTTIIRLERVPPPKDDDDIEYPKGVGQAAKKPAAKK